MWVPRMDAFLSKWSVAYEEAKALLEAEGGYLLPYQDHFFVTTAGAIAELGLDPADPDWARIGFDWVRPADAAAWQRLNAKRESAAV